MSGERPKWIIARRPKDLKKREEILIYFLDKGKYIEAFAELYEPYESITHNATHLCQY